MILSCFIKILIYFVIFLSIYNNANNIPKINPALPHQKISKTENINSSNYSFSSNSSSCIVRVSDVIFDLSILAEKDYWIATEESINEKNIYLFSICHSVRGIPTCKGRGACFTTAKIKELGMKIQNIDKLPYESAGDYTEQKPMLNKHNNLVIKYSNGFPCGNFNESHSIEIHLICAQNDTKLDPIIIAHHCFDLILWETPAACPIKNNSWLNDPCIINFYNSEFPLNLHSLTAKNYYTAKLQNKKFEINICSTIKNGSCDDNTVICEISSTDKPVSIAKIGENNMSDFKDKGIDSNLTLVYENLKNSFTVYIQLLCDINAVKPRIYVLNSTSRNEYNFSIYTINVCVSAIRSSDCVFRDSKLNRIDLRKLRKNDKNYIKILPEVGLDEIFHINICGPLIKPKEIGCSAGPIGACLVDMSQNRSINLGYITSKPVVDKNGMISQLYTGGDPCEAGAKTSSTHITLTCSKYERGPILISKQNCYFEFLWLTPSACPVSLVRSTDCRITDPIYGHEFDLQLLFKEKDYESTIDGKKFRFNMCGTLKEPCGSDNQSVLCFEAEDKQKSLAKVGSLLTFNDGVLTLEFTNGEICNKKESVNWTSKIILYCLHGNSGKSLNPDYIYGNLHDSSLCHHEFLWGTSLACPPFKVIDCQVKDGNNFYDLNPLSDPVVNTPVRHGNKTYYINFCRSVIHNKEARCDYSSGICSHDLENLSFTNLGQVLDGPYVENNRLKLKYTNGDKCEENMNYTTIIEFYCPENKKELNDILIFYAEEKCLIIFKYETVYACPVVTLQATNDCKAMNPSTSNVLDLNVFSTQKPHELFIDNRTTLLIQACGPVQDSRCDKKSGACVIKDGKAINAGMANKNLKYLTWNLELEYTDGDVCENGEKRKTMIIFICSDIKHNFTESVFVLNVHPCFLTVIWSTKEACENPGVECIANSLVFNTQYDLTPLVNNKKNYIVPHHTQKSMYYSINVCRPLVRTSAPYCERKASSCLVSNNVTESLGYSVVPPTVVIENGQQKVQLMYSRGSKCRNSSYEMSTKITFDCNRFAGLGKPLYVQETHDCQTQFKWSTSLVCPPSKQTSKSCQVSLDSNSTVIDLNPLKRSEKPYLVQGKFMNFYVGVCGMTACNSSTAAVCSENGENYGRSDQFSVEQNSRYLVMTFYDGSHCAASLTRTRLSEIYFECDPTAGYGAPELDEDITSDTDCHAFFTWRTNITCINSVSTTTTTLPPTSFVPPSTPARDLPNSTSSSGTSGSSDREKDSKTNHSWAGVIIALLLAVIMIGVLAYLVTRSTRGRIMYERLKRTMGRRGYATTREPAGEDDILLMVPDSSTYIYRPNEDERVLRI